MTDRDDRFDVVRTRIWSGFDDLDSIEDLLEDLLRDEDRSAAGPFLTFAASEFEKKARAELTWPAETDCDRLDRVFEALETAGVLALHDTGFEVADGITDAVEERDRRGRDYSGFCFYHGQDVRRAVSGEGLMIGFGSFPDEHTPASNEAATTTEVGRRVKAELERHGFKVSWNGSPEQRLSISPFDWKRRTAHRPQVQEFAEEFIGPDPVEPPPPGPRSTTPSPLWWVGAMVVFVLLLRACSR